MTTTQTHTANRSRASRGPAAFLGQGQYRATADEKPWLKRGAILYSTCDEDSRSELEGLGLTADDDVISITGSGCRSLNLLVGEPRSIVSVDANPLQNHLLELKVAGIRSFERSDFLDFIGGTTCSGEHRVALYDSVRDTMPVGARQFWDDNRHVIKRGVLFSGAHERFYRLFIAPLIHILRRRRLRELYSFTDLEKQTAFYDTKWNHLGWKTAVRMLARPQIVRLLLGDPSYFAQVNREQSFADYLIERLRNVFSRHLARDNDVFTMYVHGRYLSDEAMPLYLLPGSYDLVRSQLDKLSIVTEPIDAFLSRRETDSASKFSLSDITGWAPRDEFGGILAEVTRVGRASGRVVYRCFLTDRPIPGELSSLVLDAPMSERLAQTDRAFAFTFVVAAIETGSHAERS